MTGTSEVTFHALFVCPAVAIATLIWLDQRVERHMLEHHPVEAADFFPPSLLPKFATSEEVHLAELAKQQARRRFRQFISTGSAARLQDAALNRLLLLRRISKWTAIAGSALLIAFAAISRIA